LRSVEESYRGSCVRVFRLDRERLLAALAGRAKGLLASHREVAEVRLFGSLARGRAKPGSDADLFVLLSDADAGFVPRSADLARCFEGVGIGCDVLAFTEAEWRRMRSEGRRLVDAVEREGIVLARRA